MWTSKPAGRECSQDSVSCQLQSTSASGCFLSPFPHDYLYNHFSELCVFPLYFTGSTSVTFELINPVITSFKFVPRTFQNDLALGAVKPGCLFAFVPEPTSRRAKMKSQKLISITLFLSHAMMDFLPSLKARLMLSQPLSKWWMPCWAVIMLPSTKGSSLAFPPIRSGILTSGALRPDGVAGTFSAWFILDLRVSGKVDWIFCESLLGSARSSSLAFARDLHHNSREQRWPTDCTWYQSMQSARLPSDNRISSLTSSLRCDEVGMSHSHSYSK